MLNQTNRIIVLIVVLGYILLFKYLFFPALTGLQSTRNIQQELGQLHQQKTIRLDELASFDQLNTKWGTKLHLSQDDLLPFLLTKIDEEKIRLLDFKEERTHTKLQTQSIARFKIELEGSTYGTLRLLNALEHNFPFATIHSLDMSRQKKHRRIILQTHFYLQQ